MWFPEAAKVKGHEYVMAECACVTAAILRSGDARLESGVSHLHSELSLARSAISLHV